MMMTPVRSEYFQTRKETYLGMCYFFVEIVALQFPPDKMFTLKSVKQ